MKELNYLNFNLKTCNFMSGKLHHSQLSDRPRNNDNSITTVTEKSYIPMLNPVLN